MPNTEKQLLDNKQNICISPSNGFHGLVGGLASCQYLFLLQFHLLIEIIKMEVSLET